MRALFVMAVCLAACAPALAAEPAGPGPAATSPSQLPPLPRQPVAKRFDQASGVRYADDADAEEVAARRRGVVLLS